MGISQPTLSRALAQLGDEAIRIGAARSIQYTLRDRARGLPDIPIHQVDAEGRIRRLGTLIPVRPEGFVMRPEGSALPAVGSTLGVRREDGATQHSDGLPWWLFDLRPQGYLGRAFAARHGAELGLPARLTDWSDSHALRALLAHGHDAVGNLLLGDTARDRFLAAAVVDPIPEAQKAEAYARLAQEAARGEAPGSSAGGEQPKFTAHAMTPEGPRHVIVKFSETEESPVSERWRDLLLAEHLALATLREADIPAAKTRLFDHGGQRFLEVERFDRIGDLGRRAVYSLAALDAEFVGAGSASWPVIARRLAASGEIRSQAADHAERLWAFGALIGNTDMHGGNLSFVSEHPKGASFGALGRPHDIAPAYDMTPMAFAPRHSGGLPDSLAEVSFDANVANATWHRAEELARRFIARLKATTGFSHRFEPCIAALEHHIETAGGRIGRLG